MWFQKGKFPIQLFIFIPWPLFVNQSHSQNYNVISDYSKIKIGYSKTSSCTDVHTIQNATVAFSEKAKQRGLSFQKIPIKDHESMLFIYDQPKRLTFWMKDTSIPLQIAYFDSQGKIIDLLEMKVEKDPSHPNLLYQSSREGTVAVEMRPKTLTLDQAQVLCVDR